MDGASFFSMLGRGTALMPTPSAKGLTRVVGRAVQFDSRPTDEQLAVLAPVLAEFEVAYPTLASMPNGGIVYEAPQITPEGSPFVDNSLVNLAYKHRAPILEAIAAPVRAFLGLLGFQDVSVLHDDDFWRGILSAGPNIDACPDRVRGLWWMQVTLG